MTWTLPNGVKRRSLPCGARFGSVKLEGVFEQVD